MDSKHDQETIRRYLTRIASAGGKARARKYDRETLQEWARLGGRPPKSKQPKKSEGR